MSEQPAPTQGKVSVTEPFRHRFVEEGAERDMLGLERYGTALRTHNGRDAGQDAWEEWYDLGKYLEQLRLEHADALVEIGDLSGRLERTETRLKVVERERDEWGGKAATASAEASAFRRQRDEVVRALSNLHAAVVKLTNADPTHYEVANAVGLPALVAMQLVERYRNAAKLVGKEGATP